MTVDFVRPASVRGWCHAKAVIRVESDPDLAYGPENFYLESPAPQSVNDAGTINKVMSELVLRANRP